jgi:hypothetical protein
MVTRVLWFELSRPMQSKRLWSTVSLALPFTNVGTTHMYPVMRRSLSAMLLVVLGLSSVITTPAAANWCVFCDVHFGCSYGAVNGWVNCTSSGGGCLLDGDCWESFVSVGFSLDGTRLVTASEISREADQQERSVISLPRWAEDTGLLSASSVESFGGVTYVRGGCDNSIVSRRYSPDVGDALRGSSHNIAL